MKIIESIGYQIYSGEKSLEQLSKIIFNRNPLQVVVLVDENTKRYCLPLLNIENQFTTIEIPSGEQHKNIETATFIWKKLLSHGIERNSLILNLGGGVVGDMGGFCASVWKRGIDFIQIPTTLLSMVDASCGGKTGIDLEHVKNQIGTFTMPYAVIVDPVFLKTLPQRELLSGVAEMIKHAIISPNKNHFTNLNALTTITPETIAPLITESIEIKNNIVVQDPNEKDIRKILNFGHTVGHALETLSLNAEKSLLHGEAVALGMKVELKLAHQLQLIENIKIYNDLIDRFFWDINMERFDEDQLWEVMRHDKKNVGNQVSFALPSDKKGVSSSYNFCTGNPITLK